MRALGDLLSYAYKEEARLQKEQLEKQLFPLWLANYAVAKLQHAGEVMGYEEFLNSVLDPSNTAAPVKEHKQRTAEDIMAEFMPLMEADKRKGG